MSTGGLGRSIPAPVGAALVNVDNVDAVDRIAAVVAAHSSPKQPVLVNPLFALVAQRREPGDASDWFILHALDRYCGDTLDRAGHCSDWRRLKELARRQRIAVVGVDRNVAGFDESFRADTGVGSRRALIAVNAPPIQTAIFERSTEP